jgi:hypothetical protein
VQAGVLEVSRAKSGTREGDRQSTTEIETDAKVVAAQAKEVAHTDGQRRMKDRIICTGMQGRVENEGCECFTVCCEEE